MNVVWEILLGLFALALIILPTMYRSLDYLRFRAHTCIRMLEPELLAWLEAAERLMRLAPEDTARDFAALAGQFRAGKKAEIAQKVSLLNRLSPLAAEVAAHAEETEETYALREELDRICSSCASLTAEYNECAEKLDKRLKDPLTGPVGRLFRVRPCEKLEPLFPFR